MPESKNPLEQAVSKRISAATARANRPQYAKPLNMSVITIAEVQYPHVLQTIFEQAAERLQIPQNVMENMEPEVSVFKDEKRIDFDLIRVTLNPRKETPKKEEKKEEEGDS